MAQCPNCHSEVKPDERFCGNCGARLEPAPASAAPPAQPARPLTGKETIVLPALTETNLRPPPAPPAQNPAPPDATIMSAPVVPPAQAGRQPADATIVGAPAASRPAPLPAAPAMDYAAGAGPSTPALPGATPKKSGGNVWKVIGIIAGIAVLACVLLGIGGYLLLAQLGRRADAVFTSINSGLLDSTPIGEAISGSAPTAATSANTGAVLLQDTFDSASSSDFTGGETDSATYKFVGGAYEISITKPKMIAWAPTRQDYGDTSISVDATIAGSKLTAAGLLFHFQDDKNFYIFTVSSDGRYSLDLYKDDTPKTLVDWTEASAIKPPGQVNALRVETAGDKIRLYANDTLLDEISDSTITRGKAALAVNSFQDGGVTVKFDNLAIRGLK